MLPSKLFLRHQLLALFGVGLVCTNSFALTLEQRVERLERVANNPVILKMTQDISNQQREIQSIQNRLDLLLHKMDANPAGSNSQPSMIDQESLTSIQTQLDTLNLKQQQQDARLVLIEQQLASFNALAQSLPAGAIQMPGQKTPQMSSPQLTENTAVPKVNSSEKMPMPAANSVDTNLLKNLDEEKSAQTVPTGPIKTRLATESEDKLYQAAFDMMKKSKYQDSVQAFEEFANTHPTSSLAPNAWYWAGEGQYILGDNQRAKNAFEKVILLYPTASKESDAKLRLADALANLGELEEAKKFYQQIIDQAPTSRAAENAKSRLNTLNSAQ